MNSILSTLRRAGSLPVLGLACVLSSAAETSAATPAGTLLGAAPFFSGFTAPQDGERGGIGIGLRLREGRFMIEQLAQSGAAEKAGVEVGDQVLTVDGDALEGLTLDEAVGKIQGRSGSKVKLGIRRDGKAKTLSVVRQSLGARSGPEPKRNPAPNPAPSPEPATGGQMTLARRVVMDPQVGNRPGFEYFVPSGWRAQGAVAWDQNSSMLANMRLEIADPKTGIQLSWLPTSHFSFLQNPPGQIEIGGNWMGATFMPPPQDPNQFVQMYWVPKALTHLRGKQPSIVEQRPQVAREFIRGQNGWTANALRLRYEYQMEGRPWEEDLYFVLNFAPNQGTGIYTWNVQAAVACRAPKGGLDRQAALVTVLANGAGYTPEWLAAYGVVKQLFQKRMLSWQNDTVRFGEQLRQYNDQIARQSQQIHEERMNAWDRIAESQREYLGGVETYTDPYEHRGVYLPAGYKGYWVNQKGEYLLSEQESYDPNVGATEDWRKMPRRDPMNRGTIR